MFPNHLGILAIAAILALPTAGAAQQHEHEHGSFWNDPHGEFFLYGEGTVAAGGLHNYAGLGGGLGAGGTLFLNRAFAPVLLPTMRPPFVVGPNKRFGVSVRFTY